MTERQILMSAPMVRAILDDRKSQTRRAIARPLKHPGWTEYTYFGPCANNPTCRPHVIECGPDYPDTKDDVVYCPYGAPGDRLWVRETFARESIGTLYRASAEAVADEDGFRQDGRFFPGPIEWRPSIFMPRALSRITLEVTGVRVERLRDISEADCIAEGCRGGHGSVADYGYNATPREHFFDVFHRVNGSKDKGVDPWVWVIEFRRLAR